MLTEYCVHLQAVTSKAWAHTAEENRPRVQVEEGRKYYKVLMDHGHQRMVHSFVDKRTGDLYKPASWNAPAKGVRYNLIRDMDRLKTTMDWAGGYLYKKV